MLCVDCAIDSYIYYFGSGALAHDNAYSSQGEEKEIVVVPNLLSVLKTFRQEKRC